MYDPIINVKERTKNWRFLSSDKKEYAQKNICVKTTISNNTIFILEFYPVICQAS